MYDRSWRNSTRSHRLKSVFTSRSKDSFSNRAAASIKDAAATIAYDMMTYYQGNVSGGIVGVLPGPPPNPPTGCMSNRKHATYKD